MFKANLVDPVIYRQFKQKQILITLGIAVITGLTANIMLEHILLWVIGYTILIFSMAIWFIVTKRKSLSQTLPNKGIIEIDEDIIQIKSKTEKLPDVIDVYAADLIVVNNTSVKIQEGFKEMIRSIFGKSQAPHLIVQQNNHQQVFYFELSSYYKMNQLNKIIDGWINKGCVIERA